MNSLCTDIGYLSLNKYGENLCGDNVEVVAHVDKENETVVVLADGLGSGVKASILSTLTSKIISTMMANSMSVEECVYAIAAALPVCEVRQIAYSTFTIIRIVDNQEAEIIQYDNPHVIFLRNGKNVELEKIAEKIDNKIIYRSQIQLEENDTFIAMSDGVIHAGVGKSLNFGWQREDVIKFLENQYKNKDTAKVITATLLEQCRLLYQDQPGDDTTVCTVKIRPRAPVNLIIGPPANPADVNKMMSLFFSKKGKKIVCGGTTSTLAAEFLGRELKVDNIEYIDPEIPPIAAIDGVDLVTEGVITINKVLTYSKEYLSVNNRRMDWSGKRDGASLISKLLFDEATDISFLVGKAVNAAHQNPSLQIGFNIKMRLVEELAESLKKMGKKIDVSYF